MNGTSSSRPLPLHSHSRPNRQFSIFQILSILAFILAAFYSGLMLGMQSSDEKCRQCVQDHDFYMRSMDRTKQEVLTALNSQKQLDPNVIQQAKAEILQTIVKNSVSKSDFKVDMEPLKQDLRKAIQESSRAAIEVPETKNKKDKDASPIIPKGMNRLFAGMARVDRDEFFQALDVGVPKDDSGSGNDEVLLLYSNEKALPNNTSSKQTTIPLFTTNDATEHCQTLKVVLTEPHKKQECLALVGQWESYHVHKFMRLSPDDSKKVVLSDTNSLRHVSRLHVDSGLAQRIPTPEKVKEYNQMLVNYLSTLDTVLDELKPIASQVAKNNTLVVMVCNHGQSELLMNFACAARARGIDTSQVLVFATDVETKELAEGLGLTAFYDKTNYETMPKRAAGYYADETFTSIMMAKVYCVHMINQLGYDLLFQDVDTVWFQNPLDYFASRNENYDVYFQDDGARSVRYQPYSPNSGFYFMRHNERTEYFMHSLLMAGNIIAQSGSHQNALAAVLQDHASWRGLHVKTLDRNMDEFPNGFHFQKRKDFMKDIMQETVVPFIFHMSWTANKLDKKRFFQQMGNWYVDDKCIGKTASDVTNGKKDTNIASACCLAEPEIKCHYRDKPSKIPCKDARAMDKPGFSWW